MKHFKKFFSYLVALTMVLSLAAFTGTKVYADTTTYKLTLYGTSAGHTYEVYKVFKGTLSGKDNKKVLSDIEWAEGVKEKKTVNNVEKTIYDALAEENSAFSGVTSAKAVAEKLSGGEKDNQLVKDFAQVVGQFLGTDKTVVKASETGTSTEITGLTAGYYFVKDQDNTQKDNNDAYTRFIVQVVGDETATIKSDVPTVEKKVKDVNDSNATSTTEPKNPTDWQDSADYDIGDFVPYQITGTMPSNIDDYTSYKYVFTDTMSKGLTYNAKDDQEKDKHKAIIKIDGKTVTSSFHEDVKPVTKKNETTGKEEPTGETKVIWSIDDIKNIADPDDLSKKIAITPNTKVTVTYYAKLNDNAVLGSAGNPNTVNLTYSNNPNKGGEGDTGKTPDDKNIVFTYKTVVNKVDQDKKSLAGAAFKLEKKLSDGTYKEVKSFTAGDQTTFEFTGLDDGDYKLTETATPAGYNSIDPIEFTITATHSEKADEPKLLTFSGKATNGEAKFNADTNAGSLTTDVVNEKGSTLPSTGGMGTTLLYVAGGILVACAAAYVVMSRKHSTNK